MAGKAKEMELAIKIAGKIDKSFNSAISTVNQTIRGATRTMAIGAAAAAAAVGAITGKAVGVGKEFESSMSQVAATLQIDKATEEGVAQYAILEEAARQCGRETAFSASEAAEGLNQLAMAGYGASESAAALPTVLRLAGAGGIEMADSARYITATLAALGLDRTEEIFNHLADVMAITAAKSKTDVGQIGEAITTLGGTGQGLKGGIDEITSALGILASADITGAEGGTHLRNMILALQNPRNKNAAEMFQQLGVSAYDSQGKMRGLNEIFGDLSKAMDGMTDEQKNSIMSTLFKQTDLAAARAMLQGCGDSYNELYEAATHASDGIGAAQEMYNTQQDNLEGDISILKSALDEVGISVYKKLQPALRGATQFATELVNAFGKGFKDGGIAGGLQAVFDTVRDSIGEIPEGIKRVGAAIGAIGSAYLAGTVVDSNLWKQGVKGVTGFGKALLNAPQTFTKLAGEAGNAIKGMFPDSLVSKAGSIFNSLTGNVSSFASGAGSMLSGVWNNFAGDSALGSIVGQVNGAIGRIGGAVGQLGSIIFNIGGALFNGLGTIMSVALRMLVPTALVGAVLVALGLLYSQFGAQIDGILAMAREKGPQIISGLVAGITSQIPAFVAQGAILLSNFLSTIGALLPSLMVGGAQILVALVRGVIQNLPMLLQGAGECIRGFATGLIQAIPMIIQVAAELVLALIDAIVHTDWIAVGADIIKGIGDGIRGGAKGIWDAVKGAVTGGNKGAEQPSTPSTVAAPTMPDTSSYTSAGASGAQAYASGFSSGASGITAALESSISGTQGAGLGIWQGAGTEGATNFISGVETGLTGFDFTTSLGIDTASLTSTMTEAGTSGGQAFTTALTETLGAFEFAPESLGIDPSVMQGIMRPAGLAGGVELTTSLTSAITQNTGTVVAAAQKLGDGVYNAIKSGFNKAKSAAVSAMNSIKSSCVSSAKSTASQIKNAFEKMSIKIPKPKIPVVSVGSASKTVGTQTVSYPTFSVSYHALGGIFDKATLLKDAQGGNHVVGESGAEAILPLDTLWDKMSTILKSILSRNDNSVVEQLLQRFESAGRRMSPEPVPVGSGAGGETIYFSPTYNLYGSATRQDAEAAGRTTFEEFKRFMERYEKDKRRTKF